MRAAGGVNALPTVGCATLSSTIGHIAHRPPRDDILLLHSSRVCKCLVTRFPRRLWITYSMKAESRFCV